ncbi:response regulator transcription factor [Williamsia phyllosphaerae]|nr:response regulator transcription factor [Williamsia phyllosphaerae]
MTFAAEIAVLVVDDDPMVRRGVTDIFGATADIRVVAGVDDGDQVLDAVATYRPDVVLMDLKMKRLGGLEATEALMALPQPPKVIAMTSMDLDDVVTASIAAGAHSFLRKDEAPETFHQAVRVVAAGNTLFSLESLREIVGRERRTVPAPALRSLTAREREVLVELASGATNGEIAGRLYLGQTTVKSHVSSISTKLGTRNRVQIAIEAFRAGVVV